jgi:hypothetical protein
MSIQLSQASSVRFRQPSSVRFRQPQTAVQEGVQLMAVASMRFAPLPQDSHPLSPRHSLAEPDSMPQTCQCRALLTPSGLFLPCADPSSTWAKRGAARRVRASRPWP